MANPFDQFDLAAGNPFDQFDNAPTAADPLGITQKSGYFEDMAKSLPSGIMRGLGNGLLMMSQMGNNENFILSPQDQAGVQAAGQQVMNDNLYAPQTLPGKFVGTAGEFLVPGGLPSKAARAAPTVARKAFEWGSELLGNVVAPAVLSEGAGQTVQAMGGGPDYEAAARILGAVGGNLGAAGVRARSAHEGVLRRAAGDVTDAQWQKAIDLQNNTTGVKLTAPEALAQAKGVSKGLPDVLRVVEGSIDGGSKLAPFFAQRPEQLKAATNAWLDTIAAQDSHPTSLGPRVADAAKAAILDVEKQRTAATDPLYRLADPTTVPDAAMQRLLDGIDATVASDKTGILEPPLATLKGTLVDRAGAPITDIANLDRARKYNRDRLDLPQTGQDAITKEQGATVQNHLDELNAMMEGASQPFVDAKAKHAELTNTLVRPVADGPLGAVAKADSTTTAGDALLGPRAHVGSENEINDALTRLVMQDPMSTRGLVRQNYADRFNTAVTETPGSDASFAGAKFRKDIVGNPQRKATLDAALSALGVPADAAKNLFDVFQATGRRAPIGSATEFNRSINADMGLRSGFGRALDIAKTGGASFISGGVDAVKRVALRNSLTTLADMFTHPQGVEQLRQAIARGPESVFPEALLRSALQAPGAAN